MQHRTHDGRSFRLLTIIDEFTRKCLAIRVQRKLTNEGVLEELAWLLASWSEPRFLVHLECE